MSNGPGASRRVGAARQARTWTGAVKQYAREDLPHEFKRGLLPGPLGRLGRQLRQLRQRGREGVVLEDGRHVQGCQGREALGERPQDGEDAGDWEARGAWRLRAEASVAARQGTERGDSWRAQRASPDCSSGVTSSDTYASSISLPMSVPHCDARAERDARRGRGPSERTGNRGRQRRHLDLPRLQLRDGPLLTKIVRPTVVPLASHPVERRLHHLVGLVGVACARVARSPRAAGPAPLSQPTSAPEQKHLCPVK